MKSESFQNDAGVCVISHTNVTKSDPCSTFRSGHFLQLPIDSHTEIDWRVCFMPQVHDFAEKIPLISKRSIFTETSSVFSELGAHSGMRCSIGEVHLKQYIGCKADADEVDDQLTCIVQSEWRSINWKSFANNSIADTSLLVLREKIQFVLGLLEAGVHAVNTSRTPIEIGGFLLPARSGLYQSLLADDTCERLRSLLSTLGSQGTDTIIMDPPWPSKSAARRGVYNTLSLERIRAGLLPMRSLLLRNGIVAVWVTNDPKITEFVLNELFVSWGISAIAQWAWVKLTSSFEPVIPFCNKARKCFERVLVGVKTDSKYGAFNAMKIDRFIFSQPSALHSFKPPLDFLINELLPHKVIRPPRIELFARMVRKNYVCWGDQVLLCNHKSLWEPS